MAKVARKKRPAPKQRKVKSYLTKRVLERAISKATRNTSADALKKRGHVITAKDGWVVKVNKDGSEEKIKELPKSRKTSRFVLD